MLTIPNCFQYFTNTLDCVILNVKDCKNAVVGKNWPFAGSLTDRRLMSVDLNLKNGVYWRLSADETRYFLMFMFISGKEEEMIGSRAAWTEALQWSVTTHDS